MTVADPRLPALREWLATQQDALQADLSSLRPASADASFRRYFRIDTAHGSRVIMDAPPPQESTQAFEQMARCLHSAGLRVPEILASEPEQGFLVLTDLGPQSFYDALQVDPRPSDAQVHGWYMATLDSLIRMQREARCEPLPEYDTERMLAELELFPQWYIERHCGHTLSEGERQMLRQTFDQLATRLAAQPRVLVHRDFHSPNLMVPLGDDPRPGVLDFQDAVRGPITYDLASLLMDARTTWDEAQQLDWGIRYWEAARKAGLPVPDDIATFHADWEWMGLQRNLRILGVFARLNHRDGKPQYLAHMPRVLGYVYQSAGHDDRFRPLLKLLDRLAPPNADTAARAAMGLARS